MDGGSVDERSVRERILDAAETCLRDVGIRRTTMAAVAEAAGISRAWLYHHFADKPTLVAAALIRRDEAFWEGLQVTVDAASGLAAKIAAAVAVVAPAPLGPLAVELREREPEAFTEVIGTYVEDVLPGISWFWHRELAAGVRSGELRADLDVDAATEWVVRVVISLIEIPGTAVDATDAASVARFLDTYLMPALSAPQHESRE